MATDVAMNDMDIDFSMDADMDPEVARLQAEADAINARTAADNAEAMMGIEEEKEEGEVDSNAPVSNKVHVRGVDRLNTFDIQKFAEEHYSSDLFSKVQWIDDTSANIIYDTGLAAAEALEALSAEEAGDPLTLRRAKPLSSHPDVELHVRQAIVADVKLPGAKDRSAFYLFNKEWDPDNPQNVRPDNRKRRWEDDGHRDRKYRRRDYEDDRHHKRGSWDKMQFHEDMYGDEPQSGSDARRQSYSSASSGQGRRKVRYDDGEDLFANKDTGRLRDRSASPARDGDGRYGFPEDQPRRPTARPRSRTPPAVRQSRENRSNRDTVRKELFPERRTSSAINGHTPTSSRELFPNRSSSSNSNRELFPDKLNGSAHRRKEAKHIHPDEVADAIGKYSLDGTSETQPHAYNIYSGRRPEHTERRDNAPAPGRDLFSRINGGPRIVSDFGRLRNRDDTTDYSIKGAGRDRADDGFNILGASRDRPQNPIVKELFPHKAAASGNAGRELFDGRIKGRASQRRRAEDMF